MRMAVSGVEAFDLDQLLDLDMEVHHHGTSLPVASLSSMADALPGLGIVAAALVGTFLGILLCYGLVGPLAASMQKTAEDEGAFLYVLRVVMISFLKGNAPIMAVEFARRAIPGHVRPSFLEVETHCKKSADATPAAAEGAPPGPEAPAAVSASA
jgi:chemotaxis protein MotA